MKQQIIDRIAYFLKVRSPLNLRRPSGDITEFPGASDAVVLIVIVVVVDIETVGSKAAYSNDIMPNVHPRSPGPDQVPQVVPTTSHMTNVVLTALFLSYP